VPDTRVDRRKQVVAGVLTLAVLLIVFVGVFPRFADYSAAWASIRDMSALSLLALAGVTVANVVVYVLPYQASLPGLPYGQGFVVRQTSFMISNVVPAGGAVGVGVQYSMLSGYGHGPEATTTAIAATSVWNLLVTLGLPVVGVAGLVLEGGATAQEVAGAVAGLALLALLLGLFTLVLRSEGVARRVGGAGDWLLARVARVRHAPAAAGGGTGEATGAVLRFRDTLGAVVADRWWRLTWTSVLQQVCQFAILAVAYWGITGPGGGINVVQLFAAFAIGRLASFIPVTPGGLGTVDAAIVALMAGMGADQDDALAAVLVWRAASFFPQVIIGVVTFLVWRRQARSRRQGGTAPAGA
jgi:uncharacterized protein (TIRG00374 family)